MKGNITHYESGLRSIESGVNCSTISTPDGFFRERSAINTYTESNMEAWVCCSNSGDLKGWLIEWGDTPNDEI